MNVLVTGGTGFLGTRLALKLQKLGINVSVLGRNLDRGRELAAQHIKFVAQDLRNAAGVLAACQGQDYVFHCGALSSPWGQYRDFYDTNVVGTRHIIQGCQTHGVTRLIYVSTSAVYFAFRDYLNIPEQMPLPTPVNAYAKTKQLAEQEIRQAYQAGLPVITIRPRGIFGPEDTAILPRLIRANTHFGVPLIRAGQACIDVTYIDNVVDALLLCQNASDTMLGRVFNISNGEPITVINLLQKLFGQLNEPCNLKPIDYNKAYWTAGVMELLAKIFYRGQEPTLTRYTVGLLAFSQTLDITAATRDLGYQPQVSIEDGLGRFAQWWQENNRNNNHDSREN